MKEIKIYTDGACRGNPGPGGYGAVLIYKHHRKELSAGYRWTTNNRMELYGLLQALEALKEPCKIEIISDSKYLLDAFKEHWIERWIKTGWRTSSKEDVQNRDLWEKLERLMKPHATSFTWVKGHAETVENNRCDDLAVKASKGKNLQIDKAYEQKNPFEKDHKAYNQSQLTKKSKKEKYINQSSSSNSKTLTGLDYLEALERKRLRDNQSGGIPEVEEGYPKDEFGSRADHKKMRGRDWSDMIRRSRGK